MYIIPMKNGSKGMTLVELMVAIGVTSVVMTLSLSIFFGQMKSYKRGQETKDIQETSNETLDLLRRDLAQAGWSVRPEMSFYIQDGGAGGTDQIFINDTSLTDLNTPNGLVLMTQTNDCGSCAQITSGSGSNSVTVSTLDVNNDGDTDFKANASHYVISDLTDIVAGVNKIARITDSVANPINLNQGLGGTFLAPAVFYSVDGVALTLDRSDKSSGGAQPFAANVVDLQVAYRDRSGNWYGVSNCVGTGVGPGGGNPFCSMIPFDPRNINLIRATLVTRSQDRLAGVTTDPKHCRPAVENRSGAATGSADCGFVYRTYSFSIQPRNTNNR